MNTTTPALTVGDEITRTEQGRTYVGTVTQTDDWGITYRYGTDTGVDTRRVDWMTVETYLTTGVISR